MSTDPFTKYTSRFARKPEASPLTEYTWRAEPQKGHESAFYEAFSLSEMHAARLAPDLYVRGIDYEQHGPHKADQSYSIFVRGDENKADQSYSIFVRGDENIARLEKELRAHLPTAPKPHTAHAQPHSDGARGL